MAGLPPPNSTQNHLIQLNTAWNRAITLDFQFLAPNSLPLPMSANVMPCDCHGIVQATPPPPSTTLHCYLTKAGASAAWFWVFGLSTPSPTSCLWMHHPTTAIALYKPLHHHLHPCLTQQTQNWAMAAQLWLFGPKIPPPLVQVNTMSHATATLYTHQTTTSSPWSQPCPSAHWKSSPSGSVLDFLLLIHHSHLHKQTPSPTSAFTICTAPPPPLITFHHCFL